MRALARSADMHRIVVCGLGGLIVAPALAVLSGAILGGLTRYGGMEHARNFLSGAMFGAFMVFMMFGLPAAIVGFLVGAIIGVVRGRWTIGAMMFALILIAVLIAVIRRLPYPW